MTRRGEQRRHARPLVDSWTAAWDWLGTFRPRGVAARYSIAVLAVVAALLLRILIKPWTGAVAPFVVFFDAVFVASLLGGPGPALVCLALSLPLAVGVFLPEEYSLRQATFLAFMYAGEGLIIVGLMSLLRRWEKRARDAIELAPDAYLLSDLSGRLTDVNHAACELLGFERDELVGKTIFELIRREDAPRVTALRAELLVPGTVVTSEWALEHKDGSFVSVEISSNILADGRWQGFVRDISERERVTKERAAALSREHSLRREAEATSARLGESEERFRLTIDEAPIGMALVALDGRFLRVNHRLCEITGYNVDELKGLTFQDITHPDDRATDVDLARRLAAGELPRYQLEKRYVRKDQSIVDVMLSASVVRDERGKARYYIGQVEDITARKRTEEAMRLSEAKFSGIVSIAADAIICVDDQQRITVFNEGAEQIFGYPAGEMNGTPLERLIPERFREAHRAHFAEFSGSDDRARRMGARQDIFGLRKDGEEFPAEASIARVVTDGTTLFSVVLRDITYRKSIEAALQRAVAMRDNMLGVVAHDLRNPLGTIIMSASLLDRPAGDAERRNVEPRKIIERSARRMNRLIQDLLDVTTMEAGQLKVDRAPISARDLVREVVDMQQPLAAAEGVQLDVTVADELPDIHGDHDRLLQVFENLVGNAIKFTPKGGRIEVRAARDGDTVRFSVADSGAGIPTANLPHIFDRFWQGATEQRREGTGLGLPIAHGIVVAHEGRIWAESTVGEGSTFSFTIPVAVRDAPSESAAA